MAEHCEIVRAGKSRGPRAYDRDGLAGSCGVYGLLD
jgi:hypothetical protein